MRQDLFVSDCALRSSILMLDGAESFCSCRSRLPVFSPRCLRGSAAVVVFPELQIPTANKPLSGSSVGVSGPAKSKSKCSDECYAGWSGVVVIFHQLGSGVCQHASRAGS